MFTTRRAHQLERQATPFFIVVLLLAAVGMARATAAQQQQGALVQFTQNIYLADEGVSDAVLVLTRTGDTTGTVSVGYRTVDNTAAVRCDDTTTLPGVAFARCDYATSIDTVTFARGETQKSIFIPLIDDAFVEPQESFQTELFNLTGGATFGALAATRVTILNNDRANQPNPIDANAFFVRQQYLDFLSREPETNGFNAWLNVLNNCSDVNNNAACDHVTVAQSFFQSPEFQLKGFFIYRFYKLAFNRLPDYTEIIPDLRRVTGQTANEVLQKRTAYANDFAQRQEFSNLYANMSNAAYVQALLARYSLTQITTPDPLQPDGANKLILTSAQLASGLDANTYTRAQILRAVVQSDEVAAAEYDRALVAMQYYGFLRRTPETGGYQGWLNYLAAHPGDYRTVVRGFVDSAEYRLRFGNN